jgi:hypothetical protein
MSFSQSDFIQGEYTGKKVFTKSTSVNVRIYPGTSAPILANIVANKEIGTVISKYNKIADGYEWYLVQLTQQVGTNKFGCVAVSIVLLETNSTNNNSTSSTDIVFSAEKCLKASIEIDTALYKRILVMYACIQLLKSKNLNTSSFDSILSQLITRYSNRQTKVKQILDQYVFTYSQPSYQLYNYIRQKFGLGAIQIPAAIVVGTIAITSAVIAYAIIKALEPTYSEQETDLQITGTFKEWFDNIPNESVKSEIKADLEKQIDDAYNQGVSDTDSGIAYGSIIKYGLIAFASIWGFNKIIDQADKRKK